MKNFKGHFSLPSHPSHPIKLGLRPRFCKGYHWAPEGHCGCSVSQMYRPIRTIKTPHQNSIFMPPTLPKNELTPPPKLKFHAIPSPRKLKILTPTPKKRCESDFQNSACKTVNF